MNNSINKTWQEEILGKTPNEVLLGLLKQRSWVWDVAVIHSSFSNQPSCTAKKNLLNCLQFTFSILQPSCHQNSTFEASFSAVMWLSLTKITKTRYRLPLLHVIGQAVKNKTFSIGFFFLMEKNKLGYIWAVNNLHKTSGMLIESPRLLEVKHFLSKWPNVLEYHKISSPLVNEHFSLACASHFPHLRNLNTSHFEFNHPLIKIFISNTSGIGKEYIKSLTNISCSFSHLPQNPSKHAILKGQKFKMLEKKDLTEPCSQIFYKGYGIPFSHMIHEILKECRPIEPEDFHPQWCSNSIQSTLPSKNLLNCLQLTCRKSKKASGVTPTFHQDLFSKYLMHSHFAYCTVIVPKINICKQVKFGWQLGWTGISEIPPASEGVRAGS
ncbi:uncharacterized protein VP01_1639g11 [Puccinia sorghi]|uniref:Uncharacterized protein n=1 Tax=Puccinia sorghi TaxID=27349 RepID=A0A0L6VGU3_9BASI|nr:uncharacterized protein VP01_1639g11 [Puccinia sorghi]